MISLAAFAIGLPVFAAVAHELTHAAAARALGGHVAEVDLLRLHVDFAFDPPSRWREELVYHAPTLVGVAVAPLILISWGWLQASHLAIVLLAWLIYTFSGGSDRELSIVRPVVSKNG